MANLFKIDQTYKSVTIPTKSVYLEINEMFNMFTGQLQVVIRITHRYVYMDVRSTFELKRSHQITMVFVIFQMMLSKFQGVVLAVLLGIFLGAEVEVSADCDPCTSAIGYYFV